jgi:hypothetical protein
VYPGLSYVGSTPASGAAQPAILYFATSQTRGWAIAGTLVATSRLIYQSALPVLKPGFGIVLIGADDAPAVRIAFDSAAFQNARWQRLVRDYRNGDDGWEEDLFTAASSYEWLDVSAWKTLTSEDPDDLGDRPSARELPAAKLDDRSIRNIAAAAAASWSDENLTATSSASVQGAESARRVTLAFEIPAPPQEVVQSLGEIGSFTIPRLALDPTVASVEFVEREDGNEIVRLRYDRKAMGTVDWARFRSEQRDIEIFKSSTSYRWTDKASWQELLSQWSMSPRSFPISK